MRHTKPCPLPSTEPQRSQQPLSNITQKQTTSVIFTQHNYVNIGRRQLHPFKSNQIPTKPNEMLKILPLKIISADYYVILELRHAELRHIWRAKCSAGLQIQRLSFSWEIISSLSRDGLTKHRSAALSTFFPTTASFSTVGPLRLGRQVPTWHQCVYWTRGQVL